MFYFMLNLKNLNISFKLTNIIRYIFMKADKNLRHSLIFTKTEDY